MINSNIAEMLDEIADMLDLEGVDRRFEVLAYRKAALTVGNLQEDVGELYKRKGLEGLMELPGVGKSIAASIVEYVEKGKMSKYEDLKKKYPVDFKGITKIQGMGAKKAFKLYKALGIKNMKDLQKALEKHKIKGLEGFGEQSEEQIRKGIEFLEKSGGRMLLGTALPEAETIRDKLLASGLVDKALICGSTRRMRETVGDLDILLVSKKAENVTDFIAKLDEVANVIARGPTKTSVFLKIGLNCDFRVMEKENFGAAVQYFTGNKDHNVKVREIAIKKGLKLNEYGLFDKRNKNVATKGDEEEIYKILGMDWMQPEMRENRGEIDLALQHKLPKLIELEDIRGDLQMHSKNTDGGATIEEMAEASVKLGREYIGITDHSKSEYVTKGMDDKKFVKYFKEIDEVNKKMHGKITVLKSGEVDLLKEGTLDLEKKTLAQMDYVLTAIHTNFNMSKEDMTKRIVKALESGLINIFAHPTSRVINRREPLAYDIDKVFEAAKDNNVVMEIDSLPERLDLNDENCIKAKEYGLKFCIDTDAHLPFHLQFMRYGIGVAKRAWLTKKDVINTQDPETLLKGFKK